MTLTSQRWPWSTARRSSPSTETSADSRESAWRSPRVVSPQALCAGERPLELREVDLLHLQHRLHGPLGPFLVGAVQHLLHPLRGDLPRQAVPVLQPAAHALLAAVLSERVPEVVDLLLVLARDDERD